MNKLTFYIVRHGKTMMNTLDKVQGWCDSPLTQQGIDSAYALGIGLGNIEFKSAYCSDLRRTRQTAETILKAKKQEDDIAITEHSGFREACFGSFEAGDNEFMWGCAALYLQYTSGEEMYKDVLERKIHYGKILDTIKKLDKMGIAEGFADIEARTHSALYEIANKEFLSGGGNILLVSHGMSITTMLHNLGGYNLQNGIIDNTSVSIVTYQNNSFTVHSVGDMSYLEKGRNKLAAL